MPDPVQTYGELHPAPVCSTISVLARRIHERFPGSGLSKVAAELVTVAALRPRRAVTLTRAAAQQSMRKLGFAEAFARYGAQLRNLYWSVSAEAADDPGNRMREARPGLPPCSTLRRLDGAGILSLIPGCLGHSTLKVVRRPLSIARPQ